MKRSFITLLVCSILSVTACAGNQNTQAGDSTGTGAAGARVPGNQSADTTRHDSTTGSPKKAIYADSTSKK